MKKLVALLGGTLFAVGLTACNSTGTVTDARDGQKYKTVKIGELEWMAENLNYETKNSYCSNYSADSCAKYGRLYRFYEARNACPDGWRLPSKEEWVSLENDKTTFADLKSMKGWDDASGKGTGKSKLDILPSGLFSRGVFHMKDSRSNRQFAYFWTGTVQKSDNLGYLKADERYYVTSVSFGDAMSVLDRISGSGKAEGLSVRCVKGSPKVAEIKPDDALKAGQENGELKEERKEEPKKPRKMVGGGKPRGKGEPNAPQTRGVLKLLSDQARSSDRNILLEGVATHNYGKMVDPRDGREYKTVEIGGKTWMAENLNYHIYEVLGDEVASGFCYANDVDKCEKYGRLYTEYALDKACPEGWRIPDEKDYSLFIGMWYRYLDTEIGNCAMMRPDSWTEAYRCRPDERTSFGRRFDELGFGALAGGGCNNSENDEGLCTSFWYRKAWTGDMYKDFTSLMIRVNDLRDDSRSYASYVRCVKK